HITLSHPPSSFSLVYLYNSLNHQHIHSFPTRRSSDLLQRHNINAEKKDQGKTGFSIFVEPTDFASAVDWLKIYNLPGKPDIQIRSEEHTSELQSRFDLVCRLLLEKKKKYIKL